MSTKNLVLEILLLRAMLADRYLQIRLLQERSTRSTDRLETATLKPLEAMFRARLLPITLSPYTPISQDMPIEKKMRTAVKKYLSHDVICSSSSSANVPLHSPTVAPSFHNTKTREKQRLRFGDKHNK